MFFFPPRLGRIEGAEVLQLACGRTNRQRQTGRAETQCESFSADLGLIVVSQLGCWFGGSLKKMGTQDGYRKKRKRETSELSLTYYVSLVQRAHMYCLKSMFSSFIFVVLQVKSCLQTCKQHKKWKHVFFIRMCSALWSHLQEWPPKAIWSTTLTFFLLFTSKMCSKVLWFMMWKNSSKQQLLTVILVNSISFPRPLVPLKKIYCVKQRLNTGPFTLWLRPSLHTRLSGGSAEPQSKAAVPLVLKQNYSKLDFWEQRGGFTRPPGRLSVCLSVLRLSCSWTHLMFELAVLNDRANSERRPQALLSQGFKGPATRLLPAVTGGDGNVQRWDNPRRTEPRVVCLSDRLINGKRLRKKPLSASGSGERKPFLITRTPGIKAWPALIN